jgi:nucleotide-binding universal stress UspA family protein
MVFEVLVPMDNSKMAEKALRYALENLLDAEITVYHVVGGPTMMMGDAVGLALENNIQESAKEHSKSVFETAHKIASEYDREVTTETGLGHPARAILKRAENFETIVMGSHGRHSEDITRGFLIGNVAKTVFT